ncbi:hypothetical protein [Kitasatospora purpeofusca]|uniref:hypothetical protein n=1 Tax=Kitasatospora purpeofusca TaxID=67352 RepID=UPI003F5DD322
MMLPRVDLRWLLDIQELASPEDLSVRDCSALQAAVARHRVNTAQLGHVLADPTPDGRTGRTAGPVRRPDRRRTGVDA